MLLDRFLGRKLRELLRGPASVVSEATRKLHVIALERTGFGSNDAGLGLFSGADIGKTRLLQLVRGLENAANSSVLASDRGLQ